MSGTDPEETMPFTHQSFGAGVPPPPAPLDSPPPYGPPVVGAIPPAAWGGAYAGAQRHRGASTAKTLGIVALVCAGVSLFCCVTLPGVFAAPFAWATGARAKREIDANPGLYGNRGDAEAGVVMGIIGTVISALVVAGVVVIVVALASWNWSLV